MNRFKFSVIGFLLIFICGIQSCTKVEFFKFSALNPDYNLQKQIRIDPSLAGKDEAVCVVDGKAGIKCFASVDNSFSKVHGCEVVSSATFNAEQYFTKGIIKR